MIENRARRDDGLSIELALRGLIAEAHDFRHKIVGLLVAHEDDAALDLHLAEDDVHDALEKLVRWQQAADHLRQLPHHVPGLDGVSGLGRGQHDAVIVRWDAGHYSGIQRQAAGIERDQVARDRAARKLLHGLVAGVGQERAAQADLIAVLEARRLRDAHAVDVRAVRAIQVDEHPTAIGDAQLGMPPANRLIGERKLIAAAPDDGDVVGGA